MRIDRRAAMTMLLATCLVTVTAPAPAGLGAGEPDHETGTWFDGLESGVCFDDSYDADGAFDFGTPAALVPCDGLHDEEVVARAPYGTETYPDGDIETITHEVCAPYYEAFLGRPNRVHAHGRVQRLA